MSSNPRSQKSLTTEVVTQITHQIIHENLTNINTSGERNQVTVSVAKGDLRSFISSLVEAGIHKEDAEALGEIVASETGGDEKEPFGKRAKAWIAENLRKAADGTWRTGLNAAIGALTDAALRYY